MKQQLNRRLTTAMVWLTLLACSYSSSARELSFDRSEYYPAFSRETVPVAFHFRKKSTLMTEEEAKCGASKSNFICLEKAHANKQFEFAEGAIEAEVKQLKKYNSDMKAIFYRNTFCHHYQIKNSGNRKQISCSRFTSIKC